MTITHKIQHHKPLSFHTTHLDLEFNLDLEKTVVYAKQHVERTKNAEPNEPWIMLAKNSNLQSIKLNGQALSLSDYKLENEKLIILHPPLKKEFTLETVNHINPSNNERLTGIYRSGGIYTSHCEPEDFSAITPFDPQPNNISTYTVKIIADRTTNPILLSNGNQIDAGQIDEKRHYIVRHDGIPKPSYLFALVAGDMPSMTDQYITQTNQKKVDLKIYSEVPEKISATYFGLQILKKAMAWDESRYGLEYDLDNYNIVGVRLFNAGACENKALNIFLLSSILAQHGIDTDETFEWVTAVVAHEFAHNKAGNITPIEKWYDLTLKEGMATYLEQEFCEKMLGKVLPRIDNIKVMRFRQFLEDASANSHPVRPDSYQSISNFYTPTIYNKGAEVLRMLHTLMGEDNWVKGIRHYFQQFWGKPANLEDFISIMQESSGRDLSQFFRWYTQAGTPELEFETYYDKNNKTYTIIISQETKPTPDQKIKLPLHIPIQLGLLDREGNEIVLQQTDESTPSGGTSVILELIHPRQSFVFKNIAHEPIPSILRNFSAPVKIRKSPLSNQELQFLVAHDTDLVNRWDNAQQLMERKLFSLIEDIKSNRPLKVESDLIETFHSVLLDKQLSPGLRAKMLTFPSVDYILSQTTDTSPDCVLQAHDFMSLCFAQTLRESLLSVYKKMQSNCGYQYTPDNAEKRKLKNTCLKLLLQTNQLKIDDETINLAKNQFNSSGNTSDILAAMRSVTSQRGPDKQQSEWLALQDKFLQNYKIRFKHEPMLMDEYLVTLALNRAPNCIERIRNTISDPSLFTLTDPSHVRSLLRHFLRSNIAYVHEKSGKGYELLADATLAIDNKNSDISCSLIKGLVEIMSSADKSGVNLILKQLRRIHQQPGLSSAAMEIVERSLPKDTTHNLDIPAEISSTKPLLRFSNKKTDTNPVRRSDRIAKRKAAQKMTL